MNPTFDAVSNDPELTGPSCVVVLQPRPSFADILKTLDVWSAGGHGWPAVPLSSRVQPAKNREQQQQQAQPQEQQQQQLQQVPRQEAPMDQLPLSQPQGEGDALSPVPPAGSLQRQGAGAAAAPAAAPQPLVQRAARTNGEAGLNMHMSWSEVDINE
jgi:hypothetical protein